MIEVLNVWEVGVNKTLLEKSLHLLAVACSVTDLHDMASLSIGERDARLLQLREWMFGSRLMNRADCPECSEQVEWETDIGDIRLQALEPKTSAKVFTLAVDGFIIRFRLPNSRDLFKVTSDSINHKKLIAECILEVRCDQKELAADDLPDPIWEALSKRMGEEDPQADISMLLNCPVCAHHWASQFDIVSYLWLEIDHWAKHILYEVYVLARAFGWSEYDILSMSPQRRQLYLEMVRS